MSFAQFANGAECGPANPMAGLMKQFHQDRSLQQDRFHGAEAESSKAGGFRSRVNASAAVDRQFTEEFLRDDMTRPMQQQQQHPAFEFGGLSRELESIHHKQKQPAHPHQWTNDFMHQQHAMPVNDPSQYEEFDRIYEQNRMQAQQWRQEFTTFEPVHQQPMMAQHERQAFEAAFDQAKQGAEINWDKEFAEREAITNKEEPASDAWVDDYIKQSGSETSGNMWSTEFAAKNERGWAEEFEEQQQQQPAPAPARTGNPLDDWIAMYKQSIAPLNTAQDAAWDNMQKDWNHLGTGQQGQGYRAVNPEYEAYRFAIDNPYTNDPTAIERKQQPSLTDTILSLEAKAKLEPNNANTWQQLGLLQQENERDGAAIAALNKALSQDPSLLNGWLALAVSYSNENCRAEAHDALENWMKNNEKYKDLANRSSWRQDRHAHITNMFLDAARSSPELDADVQIGLGVLFNMSEEYAKAVDCYKAALQSRPRDYLLWNKLGATLANAKETSAAIDAYFNALEINPSYVRARYNLAISCINFGQHREAAEHLLTALAIQQTADTRVPMVMDQNGNRVALQTGMSDNVWDSLRMLMSTMNRPDLAGQCNKRNLDAFRGEFDF